MSQRAYILPTTAAYHAQPRPQQGENIRWCKRCIKRLEKNPRHVCLAPTGRQIKCGYCSTKKHTCVPDPVVPFRQNTIRNLLRHPHPRLPWRIAWNEWHEEAYARPEAHMSPATLAVPAATTNALVASPITRPLALTSSSRISPPLSPESVAVHGSRSSLAPTVDSSKGSGLISTSWDTSPFREQENHRKSSATSMISVVSQSSGSNSSSPPLPILSLLVRMRDEMDLVIASERKRRDRGEYTRYAARYSDDPELLQAYYIGYFEALVNGGFDRAINAEERKTHKIAEKSKGKEHQT